MGRKNKRKNNVSNAKLTQAANIESRSSKQAVSDFGGFPAKEEIAGSQQHGKNGLSALPPEHSCLNGEVQARLLLQEQDQQEQDGEDEEDQPQNDERFLDQQAPRKSNGIRTNLNNQNVFPQQSIQRTSNHFVNENIQKTCGLGCSCRSERLNIRRFERKEISKSCDDSMKRIHHSNYQGDDDDDEQYEDSYESSNPAFAAKPLYYNLPTQQQVVQAKLQEKKQKRIYANLLSQAANQHAEENGDNYENLGEDDEGHVEEYDEEVEEEEEEEEEEDGDDDEDEDEEAECEYQPQQGFQIPYQNTRDVFDPLEILSYSKMIFKQQKQQQQQQLLQQQQSLQQPMYQLLSIQQGQQQSVDDEEEDDEEEEDEDQEYASQIEAAYQNGYAFQEDKITQEHLRLLNNPHTCTHIDKTPIIKRPGQGKTNSNNHPFMQVNAQNLNAHLQKQILLHQQQQQQQQLLAQQSTQIKQSQLQQTGYPQNVHNQQGQTRQQQQQQQQSSPRQSTQQPQQMQIQSQQLQQQQQQSQQFKTSTPQIQQKLPQNNPNIQQQQQQSISKQPKQTQENLSRQQNCIHGNKINAIYPNGQLIKGCKTPSTDDNSEYLNLNAPALAAPSVKSKKSSPDQQNGSAERQTPTSKPKADSEKKNYTPPQQPQLPQQCSNGNHCSNCNNSDASHHLNFLQQSKYKFVKDEYLDLEQILQKIYFDQYSYDELKEFVFPALREISNINSFFDILFNSIRLYAEEVKNQIHQQLKDITLSCFEGSEDGGQGQLITQQQQQQYLNRIPEIRDFERMINNNFKHFSKEFLNITSQIYQQYSAVEEYSKQTEKIVHLYINHFIEKNRSIRFNCTDLHKRIFIFFVFNDQMISNYLEAKINFFKSKFVYGSGYNECLSQLSEMHNILIKKSQFIPSEEHPINIEIYEKETCDEEEEDEEVNHNEDRFSPPIQYVQQQNATINQKFLKKRSSKKNKNYQLKKQQQQQQQSSQSMQIQMQQEGEMNNNGDSGDIQYYEEAEGNYGNYYGVASPNGITNENTEVKKKKKKKKKGKNGIILSPNEGNQNPINAEEDELQRANSASGEQPKKDKKKGGNCPMNEELEQFVKRLEESYKKLNDVPKIQPIISEVWLIKLKERYTKLKIKLNK